MVLNIAESKLMASSQPNILFIVLDTQRRDRLSLYGYDKDTSPNLDAFALCVRKNTFIP